MSQIIVVGQDTNFTSFKRVWGTKDRLIRHGGRREAVPMGL